MTTGQRDGPHSFHLGAIVGFAGLILLIALSARLSYGVDFTDEAFYAAVPYSFCLGNRPFVNEFLLQQTAGFLTLPLVYVYTKLAGTTGIILFLRILYAVAAAASSLLCYRALRRTVAIHAAAASSLVLLAFVPFAIPALSYNTIGLFAVTVAAICGATATIATPSRGFMAVHVLGLVTAIVAYPPLAAPLLLTVAAVILFRGPSRTYVATLAACALILATFAFLSADAIGEALDYMRRFQTHGGGWAKVVSLFREFRHSSPYPPLMAIGIFGCAMIASVRKTTVAAIGFVTAVTLLAFPRHSGIADYHFVVIYATAALAPAALMHGHRTTYGRRLLLVAGLTGIVGGLTTAWTSSNGLANAVIGLMPALIVSLALLADRTPTFPLRVLAIGAIVLLAASLHYGAWHYPYREDAISKLTARITSGPYAGLATIPDKRKLLVDLQADLRHEFAGATRTVLFYDNFPAGYLMAALRPLAPSVWIPPSDQYPQFDRSFYSHYYSVPEHLPDIVVEFRSIPITEANEVSLTALPYSMRGFFWRLGYPVVADREHYTVYRRCKTCAFSVYDLEMATTVKPIPNYAAAAERGWTWYVNPLADGGRAAVTTHPQASISLALSDVPPGPQFVDLSFYCYGPEARNELALSGGATSRRIVIGPGCPGGWHRAANLRLEELTSPLEIRAVSIGQPAIIVDTLLIRRQSAIALRPVMRGFVSVSEESFAWRRLEAENLAGVEQSSDYASKAGQGWVSYRSPELSKGSAAITTRAGSPLDASIPDFVRNADYAVSLAVHNYNSPSRNEIEIRQGTQTQLLSFGPESPAGLTRRDVTFNNVQSPQLTVRAAAIGQEALILDYIEVRRIGSPP